MTLLTFLRTRLFPNKYAVIVFRADKPPVKGDTITVGNLIAEFREYDKA